MANIEPKVIRFSKTGNLGTFNTIPGNGGELSIESAELETTILGSEYSSAIAGVRDWSVSAPAMFRETAGFMATIKRKGVGTPTTDIAMTEDGGVYQATTASERLWDVSEEIAVYDDAVQVDSDDIIRIDGMFGRVTFRSGYVVTGPITVDATVLGLVEFGCAQSVSLTMSAEAVDQSCFSTIDEGFNVYRPGLKTASLSTDGFYLTGNTSFEDLKDAEDLVIEIDVDGSGSTVARGIFRLQSIGLSGDVGQSEDESLEFSLSVPDGFVPFSFFFGADTKAPAGLQEIIESWEANETGVIIYAPYGLASDYYEGEVVLTDVSMSVSTDSLAEFSIDTQGTGALSKIHP